jgi:hypothetical protein
MDSSGKLLLLCWEYRFEANPVRNEANILSMPL